MLTTCGSHHLWGNVGYRYSAYQRFSNLVGIVQAAHNPDSWEGWHWGGMHMWGNSHRLGNPEQYDLLGVAQKHSEMIVWAAGYDPEILALELGESLTVGPILLKRHSIGRPSA
jgi:hypothetical protein